MRRYNLLKYLWVVLGLVGLLIIAYVLCQSPQPGVADQGDFDRVMNVSGLELKPEQINDPGFVRFLDYPVTEYRISAVSAPNLLKRLSATSMAYLITLINSICLLLGKDTFKTAYLAAAYVIMYSCAFYVIFKHLNVKNRLKLTLFVLIAFFVFLDGNYLVWFNSLYGEPMMITTLALYIAAWLYYIYHRHIVKSANTIFLTMVPIFAAAFLFLGSKLQVISALPVIILMLINLWRENRGLLKPRQVWLFGIFSLILVAYSLGYAYTNKQMSEYTRYNSLFYGILKDSPNPAQDLLDLGLSPDMAADAGKHAFLEEREYVRYVPLSDITREEFYNKISNADLVRFYITHPQRLAAGMQYTADHAFTTSTVLGKYQRADIEKPVSEFDRFTAWSSLREKYLPRSLWFLIFSYGLATGVSVLMYIKRRGVKEVESGLRLFWAVMLIGLLQFPMPLVGNGQADTAKQLFLFNFTFDIVLVVLSCLTLSLLIDFCRSPKTALHRSVKGGAF
jgi:hypothetical protein